MLKRISNTNIKAMGVDAFLYDRLGGKMGELNARNDEAMAAAGEEGGMSGQAQMSLDAIMDKKKVYQETKVLAHSEFIGLSTVFSKQKDNMGLSRDFQTQIDVKTGVTGTASICYNAFT